MRVVLDTNVLFSALWQPLGNPAKVEVLARARFLDQVPRAAIVLLLPPLSDSLSDPSITPFLEVALAAGAELVRGKWGRPGFGSTHSHARTGGRNAGPLKRP